MNLSAYCQGLEAGNKGATLNGETWVCIHADNTTSPLNLQAACETTYSQRPILAEEITPGVPFSWKCFLASASEGGKETGGGRTATTTSVSCNYVFATFTDTCTATVTGSPTPTGQVSFTSAAGGVFTVGSSCNLVAGAGSAGCSVQFQPTSTSLATVTSTRITASYAGNAANQSSSGSTVFGSAFLIERQETALREGCAQAQGGGAELTPTGVNATLNVVVPGTVTVTIIGFEGGGSTLPVSLPRLHPVAAASSQPATGGAGCSVVVAWCNGCGTLPVSLPRLHPVAAAAAAKRKKPKPKLPLIASLTRHLTRGGKTKLLIPYTAHGRKVERAFIKQLRAYKHHHTRGARKPRLKLKLTLGYKPG